MNDWKKFGGAILLLLAISLLAGCPAQQWESPAPDRPDTINETIVEVEADTLAVDTVP